MATWSSESIKNELLHSLRTENPIMNAVISSIVIGVFSWLLTYSRLFTPRLASMWRDFSILRVRKIYVSGRIFKSGSRYLDVCSDFSLKFKAVMHRLNKTSDSWSHTKILSEVPAAYNSRYERDKTDFIGSTGSLSQLRHDIWCKTHITKKEHEAEKAAETSESTAISFEIFSSSLGLHDLKKFVNECVEEYEEAMQQDLHKTQHYFVYDGRHKDTDELVFLQGEFHSNKSFDNVFFDGSSELKSRVIRFEGDEGTYKRLGVPYTLGILLHGCPGTGKTSAVKAIANLTGRHVIILRMSKIKTGSELRQIFTNARIAGQKIPTKKRLYVLEEFDVSGQWAVLKERNRTCEDVDAMSPESFQSKIEGWVNEGKSCQEMFSFMKTKEDDDPVTLGLFLEILDGMLEDPARMIVVTTNHRGQLDAAIVRPGRIDVDIDFKKATRADIAKLYRLFYRKDLSNTQMRSIKDYKFCHAEITQTFLRHQHDSHKGLLALQVS